MSLSVIVRRHAQVSRVCVSWPCLLLHGLLGPLQGFPVWQEGQGVIWRDHHFKYRGLWPSRHTFGKVLVLQYPDTSEIDTLGQVADALLSCHAEPQELPGGHHLASVLPPGYNGESTRFSVRTQGQQGSCAI